MSPPGGCGGDGREREADASRARCRCRRHSGPKDPIERFAGLSRAGRGVHAGLHLAEVVPARGKGMRDCCPATAAVMRPRVAILRRGAERARSLTGRRTSARCSTQTAAAAGPGNSKASCGNAWRRLSRAQAWRRLAEGRQSRRSAQPEPKSACQPMSRVQPQHETCGLVVALVRKTGRRLTGVQNLAAGES